MPDIDIIQFHHLINWAFETGSTMSRVTLCFEPIAPFLLGVLCSVLAEALAISPLVASVHRS